MQCLGMCTNVGEFTISLLLLNHPQIDGVVRRFNGTLKSMVKRSLSSFHGQWDQALPFILGEYHSSPCRATGFTPTELLLGKNLNTPLGILKNQLSCEDSDYVKKGKSLGRYFTDLIERMEKMRDLAKEKEERYKEECKNYYYYYYIQNFSDLANFFLGYM